MIFLRKHKIGVVASQKIERVDVVGIEPMISTFPTRISDRYAIGPIGPAVSSHGHP